MFGIRRAAGGDSVVVNRAGGRHALRPGAHRAGDRATAGRPLLLTMGVAIAVLAGVTLAEPRAMADDAATSASGTVSPSTNPSDPAPSDSAAPTETPTVAPTVAPTGAPTGGSTSAPAVKTTPARKLSTASAHKEATKRASRSARRGTKAYNLIYAANYSQLVVGWNSREFGCLNRLWTGESNWRTMAKNRRSGAYGIPQALPGHKMRTAGRDWKTNPDTQIRWGVKYIKVKYGTPCKAMKFKRSHGWY